MTWGEQISEVECLVPDMTGNARGKFIPAHQFLSRGDLKLPESIMVQTVTGEYTDEHWDFVEPTDTDMLLVPDPNTLRKVPWAREPTAQIIADCYKASGEPPPLASRNVLKHIIKLYEEVGLRAEVAEVEFFLVHKNTDPDYELMPLVVRGAVRSHECHSASTLWRSSKTLWRTCTTMSRH